MGDYAKGRVFFNGGAMVEITSVTRRTESGLIEVVTLENGLSGYTPGGGRVTHTINYAIPLGGPEVDVQGACARHEDVTIQSGWGPKSYMATGKILSEEVSQSTDANADGSFEWQGPLDDTK